MCKFCEALMKEQTIELAERSIFIDDNFCEKICNEWECKNCNDCIQSGFALTSYSVKDSIYLSIEYYRSGYGITVHPFSESMAFNFCPYCGTQLSKTIVEFNECDYRYSIREE